MKLAVLLTFEISRPEDTARILEAIDPPELPMFAGKARIMVDPVATAIENWLDEDDS